MSKYTALYARTFFADPERIFRQTNDLMWAMRDKNLGNPRLFIDDGFVADDDNRPAFASLMNEIQNRKIDTVIVIDAHYLEQRAKLFWETVRTIHEQGVRLILVKEKIDVLPDDIQEDENILDTEPHFKSVDAESMNPQIGPWGQLRCDYLEEERPGEHYRLFMKDILDQTLIEINETAEKRLAELIQKMQKSEGVTDKLKAENRNEWILRMNGIRARAADIVKEELIFK